MSIKPLRILHAAETCRGGVSSWLEEVMPWQVAQGASVALLVPQEDTAPFTGIKGLNLIGYRWGGRSIGALLRFTLAFLKAFLAHTPQVVHLHSTFAGVIGRIVLLPWVLAGRVKVIYTPHGWSFAMNSSPAKKRAYACIERLLQPFTRKIIAVSNGEKALALSYGLKDTNIVIIANAAKALVAKPAPRPRQSKVSWLFIGRFDRQKGLDILLQAASLAAGKNWHLTIVGEPVHGAMPVIPAAIRQQVTMLGWQPRASLGGILCAHDVLVMPSRWEGMPMLAIEALSCALPIVASNVGGLNEVVENGVCGLLVPPDDAPALAQALLSNTASAWHTMGVAARARHKALFLPQRMNEATWRLYN